MAAGASSAVLSCPAELLMIQQQSTGESLVVAARRTGLRQLYRGLVRPRHTCVQLRPLSCAVTATRTSGYVVCTQGSSTVGPLYRACSCGCEY